MFKHTRLATFVGTFAALAITTGVAFATVARRPHLTLASISASSTEAAPGSTFSMRFVETNTSSRVRASTVTFYFSPTATLSSGAIRLTSAHVNALKPHNSAKRHVLVDVPTGLSDGSYFLIGCINRSAATKRRGGKFDCRGAGRAITVMRTEGGTHSNGGGGGGGGGSRCVPTENPTPTSSSPTCFDGDAADGIFVSPSGNDANPGTMSAPKRTLADGIAAAVLVDRDVYVASGVYPELLTVANGVSVYGGYDSRWQRSPANVTKITGESLVTGTFGAQANDITKRTTLQLLTLEPGTSPFFGESTYGLEGIGDTGLVLDHLTVVAAPAAAGSVGLDGAQGANGGNGDAQGGNFGWGGTSADGNVGGNGGAGGVGSDSGLDGQGGQPCSNPRACDGAGDLGGSGGFGGVGGGQHADGTAGLDGVSGQIGPSGAGGGSSGDASGSGIWLSQPGQSGQAGTDGGGGGGGGGGGSDEGGLCGLEPTGGDGGGGGGGGQGGGGGRGGQGGGGSFGIFLVSSPGAVVRDSSVTASGGGAGGNGGSTGFPGTGGLGQAGFPGTSGTGLFCTGSGSAGGNGGNGAPGGFGGAGGGGAGGPSIGIFGLTQDATPGTTVSHGDGGVGGAGGQGVNGTTVNGGSGATGLAADYM